MATAASGGSVATAASGGRRVADIDDSANGRVFADGTVAAGGHLALLIVPRKAHKKGEGRVALEVEQFSRRLDEGVVGVRPSKEQFASFVDEDHGDRVHLVVVWRREREERADFFLKEGK